MPGPKPHSPSHKSRAGEAFSRGNLIEGARKLAFLSALSFLAWFFASPGPAWAQESQALRGETAAGDTATLEVELPPLLVEDAPVLSERELENPTRFMTVINVAEELAPAATVSEALSKTVGVKVNSWGGLGVFATVSIRGSSPTQVEVFLDGVPLNRAATGFANLEDLPLDDIAYIEVFRGFTPPDFGSSGIGGAVNLVTRGGEEKAGRVMVSYGSFDTLKTVASASGPAGKSRVFLFFSRLASRGDFEYVNDNGTPANKKDDFTDTRRNNDFVSYDLAGRLGRDFSDWEVSAALTGHWKDQGLAGLSSSQAERTRLKTERAALSFSARNRFLFDGRVDLTLGGDGLYENQVYEDPEGELGTGGPTKAENRMQSSGARAKALIRPDSFPGRFNAFLEYREESFQPVSHLPDFSRGRRQSRVSLTGVLQAEVEDPTGAWTFLACLRQEEYENRIHGDSDFAWLSAAEEAPDSYSLTSPSAGIRYRPADWLTLKANAGRFYRVPTFYELFGDRGLTVGNPELKPEVGINFDLGFSVQGRGLGPISQPFLEYAFFQSRMDDLILFFQNSQRTIRAVNLGEALIGGHELSFRLRLWDRLDLSGNYTFQAAVDRGEVPAWRGNQLPFRPMHEAFFKAEYATGGGRFRGWAEADYTSGNYWDRANLFKVEDRRIYNLGARMEPWRKGRRKLALSLEAKNLLDETIADIAGYPLPGRSYYLGVEVRW